MDGCWEMLVIKSVDRGDGSRLILTTMRDGVSRGLQSRLRWKPGNDRFVGVIQGIKPWSYRGVRLKKKQSRKSKMKVREK